MVSSLKELLVGAARHNVDLSAGEGPIRYLIDIGCDLEADILPTVARTVPDLPRRLGAGARKRFLPCATGASLMLFPGGLIRLDVRSVGTSAAKFRGVTASRTRILSGG
jgi:hypothetical protein